MAAFYKPYLSDDSDSETDSDGYTSEESLLKVAGNQKPVPSQTFTAFDDVTQITKGGAKFTVKESRNTTLFMINSRDRDANVYPQPTFFTIRLPRPFRNVKTVNISQLNLLNSFYNFTTSKSNTTIHVYEQGRTSLDTQSNVIPTVIPVTIPDGTYSVANLVTALSNAMNATPIFADITLGSFITSFQTTGDYTLIFNTPGSIVYNSLTQTYDSNKTITDIVARYFQTVQTIGQSFFSYYECVVAYYYPVIKEMVIANNQTGIPVLFALTDVSGQPLYGNILTENDLYNYVVFLFTGLNDPIITAIVQSSTNLAMFDSYRYQNTFNTSLVNQYTCTYNSQRGFLNITAPSLNPSIQNDLNTQYNFYLNSLVLQNGIGSVAEFNSQYTNISYSNSILIEHYNFIQSRFTSNFAINFGSYSKTFFSNLSNTITLYNPINEFGWKLSLQPSVSLRQIDAPTPTTQVSTLWRNISIDKDTLPTPLNFINTLTVPMFDLSGVGTLGFSNAGENVYGYTDVVFNLPPTNYARVAFTSPCRQSLSIMTIPRYITNRTNNELTYNFGYSNDQTPLLFNTDLNTGYVSILTDPVLSVNFNLYTITQSMFSEPEYMRCNRTWLNNMTPQILNGYLIQDDSPNFNTPPSESDISINTYRPYIFFQVNADEYQIEPTARFQITLYIENNDGSDNCALPNTPIPDFAFNGNFVVTWYRDRAGFMADVQLLLDGASFVPSPENPRNYFQQFTVPAQNTGSLQVTVPVNNLEKTYFIVRPDINYNGKSVLNLRVFALLTDTYGWYSTPTTTQEAIVNRYQMPFSTILSTLDKQKTPFNSFTTYANPLSSIYGTEVFKLGYDSNGISNNLLDYSIQGQNSNLYDPANIEDYFTGTSSGLRFYFNYFNGGATQPSPELSTSWSLFFGPNSANTIADVYNQNSTFYTSNNGTTFSTIGDNEFTLLNWFNSVKSPQEQFIYPSVNASYATQISSSSVFLPCMNKPSQLNTDIFAISTITDPSGFCGLSFFLPPNQLVKMNTVIVKLAYTQPTSNANTGLAFSRANTPLVFGSSTLTKLNYNNANATISSIVDGAGQPMDISGWDDWYFYNRRNLKLAVFNTADIANKPLNSIELSNALCSLTLENVTQVTSYQNQLGTLLTREPEWATYYKYTTNTKTDKLWDVRYVDWSTSTASSWRRTVNAPDFAPTYYYGNLSSANYFQTYPVIHNYSYLPRSFGIAPSVANAAVNPTLISSYSADIPNSYTLVPFYFESSEPDADIATQGTWRVGSFFGVTFTLQPALPTIDVLGAAPYAGPAGTYAWTATNSVCELVSTPVISGTPTSVFYWNTRITYNVLDVANNPANDLSLFGGYSGMSQEYQDTYLFLYSNATTGQDSNDISKIVSSFGQIKSYFTFGQESVNNYVAYDDQSGYNLLSYLNEQPVRGPNIEYAVHVRAYDPIPRFTTGLRFIGKNYTDFGSPSLEEIAHEISSLSGYVPITDVQANSFIANLNEQIPDYTPYNNALSTNNAIRFRDGNRFSHEYADALINFDRLFSTSVLFGKKVGFPGLMYDFVNYSSCINQYTIFYSTTINTLNTYTSILSTATGQLNSYTFQRYGNILPSSILARSRITDPLPFQLLLSSFLVPPYTTQYDQWGLGYNLGFDKIDTSPSVSVTSATFIRIVEDYIYLQLNPEFNMNSISVSGKEDKSMCLDSAAQESRYFSKILLNDFGSYCRTAVQMPITFNPVLGKYESLSCQLLDRSGNPISNTGCEYDFVLEIVEITNGPGDTDSLVATNADLNVVANNL